ncbi:hypothetical protein [Peribacillus sp. YIM B13477]|uniref:hypothetical protein n=1 Tax=Peribacillus sp. YIM B13477 TaxID=3366300 RepID=UPI00366B22CE
MKMPIRIVNKYKLPCFERVKWMPYENVEQSFKTKVLRSYLSGQEQPERFAEDTAEGGRGRHFSN